MRACGSRPKRIKLVEVSDRETTEAQLNAAIDAGYDLGMITTVLSRGELLVLIEWEEDEEHRALRPIG